MKQLYLWARFTSVSDTAAALKAGLINEFQEHCIDFKRPMLNPNMFWLVERAVLRDLGFLHVASECAGAEARRRFAGEHAVLDQEIREHQRAGHRGLFADHDGGGHLLGHVDGPDLVLVGLRAAVPGGAGILGAGVLASSCRSALSKAEPFKTILRQTEQHDLGKLTFAFVMLNIYLAFGQFLIIWSGNLPEEIPLVPRSHSRPLGHHHHARLHLPLADSVLAAAVARHQAQQEAADARVPVDDLRQGLRSVLADRAELQRCRAQPALQLGNSGIRRGAGGDGFVLGCLFLHAAEDAAAGADQRSACGGDSGA